MGKKKDSTVGGLGNWKSGKLERRDTVPLFKLQNPGKATMPYVKKDQHKLSFSLLQSSSTELRA